MFGFDTPDGGFCWLDLAASDAGRARDFYARAFGWSYRDEPANGGSYTLCLQGEREFATVYQLQRAQLERGVPSHWTPYLRVSALERAVDRVRCQGGRLIVAPFEVSGRARIAVIEDAVGALVGLWESPD